MEAFGEKFHD
jgi:hypothetical protein